LLKKTMDLANEVRGLLKIFGVRLPRTVKHGSFDGLVTVHLTIPSKHAARQFSYATIG
jgi:hypothetical protein